jgi:pSer/pThr/pTyr-binding forkhead associated (FHA) protein/pimeloyl-ACP methyl ester carboxylesterase
MKATGFFIINVGDPDGAAAVVGGYSVLLGWAEGVPYLVDLGSAGKILVNGTAVDPNTPVVIQVGDRITIGNTNLTWNAGFVPVQPDQAPKMSQSSDEGDPAPEEAAAPVEERADRIPAEVREATLQIAKQVVEQVREGTADPTLFVQKLPAEPATPEIPVDDAEMPSVAPAYKTVQIDMDEVLEHDEGLDFESTTILRDTRVPHLVLHTPNRTWEVQFTKDPMTIGRGEENDIPLPDESVSQSHALIERRGSDFVIRDTGSSNGTWLGKQRIEEHTLTSGDELSLGRAKMVFKGGFGSDDLTLFAPPRIDGKPTRRPVVFVPGLMGSQLWIGSERIWPDPKTIISNPEIYNFPGDPRIEARGIVNDVVIVPHIIQSRQYSALGNYMESGLGYTRGKDLLEFSYDWRQDVRVSAQRLAEAIEDWRVEAPITVIGHSLGTYVTRYYVEKLGGKKRVERVILMGGPHSGTPKGLAAILSGPGMLPFGLGDERMRRVLATFESAYQILPTYPCITDQNGNNIDLLKDDSWLPEDKRPMLEYARDFWREVGTTSSVPAVSIFGYGLKTKLRASVERGPYGQLQKVEFEEEAAGDLSVPAASAVLKDSEIHPVLQEHGSLYVDDDVKMRLKVELTRSTTWQGKK